MTITAQWTDRSRTILHVHFRGSWSLDALYEMISEVRLVTDALTHPYVVIADLTNSVSIPSQILSTGRYVEALPNKAHQVIIIGNGRFLEMTVNTYQQQFPRSMPNLTRSDTLGEAYQLARETISELHARYSD